MQARAYPYLEQNPRHTRRNVLPPAGIDGLLLMGQKHAPHAPVALLEIRKTAASPQLVLPHPPKAFKGMAGVAASGGPARQPPARRPMGQRRGERVRPVDAPALDDHHPRFPGGANRRPHVRDSVPHSLGSKRRDKRREDCGRSIGPCPNHPEHDPTGEPAPGALASPGVACAGRRACDWPRAQGTRGQTGARCGAPPAGAGQGQAPQARCIGLAHDALAPAGLVCERRACD